MPRRNLPVSNGQSLPRSVEDTLAQYAWLPAGHSGTKSGLVTPYRFSEPLGPPAMLATISELLRFGKRRSREEVAAAQPIVGHLLTTIIDGQLQAQMMADGTGTGAYRDCRIAILNPLLQVQLDKIGREGFALRGTQRMHRHGQMYEFLQIWWAVPYTQGADETETSDPFTHPECCKVVQEGWETSS